MASSCSIELYNEEFSKRIEACEEGIMMIEFLKSNPHEGKASLREIRDTMTELSAMMSVIRKNITNEKEKIEKMRSMQEQLCANKHDLNHMIFNLPEALTQQRIVCKDVCKEPTYSLPSGQPASSSQHSTSSEDDNKENKKRKKNQDITKLEKVDAKEYEKVPKHVRSHLSLEHFDAAIQEINQILEKKYSFLKRPRNTLTRKEDKKRMVYLQMASDVKGTDYRIFFMDSDIQIYGKNLKIKPKTKETVFLILRHLGKMKEIRQGKPPRYCILY